MITMKEEMITLKSKALSLTVANDALKLENEHFRQTASLMNESSPVDEKDKDKMMGEGLSSSGSSSSNKYKDLKFELAVVRSDLSRASQEAEDHLLARGNTYIKA